MKKNAPYKKLDWSISSQQQRQKIVQKIVDDTPAELLTSQCLEELASYLTQTQKTKKDKTILTDNRLVKASCQNQKAAKIVFLILQEVEKKFS